MQLLNEGQLLVEVFHTMHLTIRMTNEEFLAVFQCIFNDRKRVNDRAVLLLSQVAEHSTDLLGRPAQVKDLDCKVHALFRQLDVLLLELLVVTRVLPQRLRQRERLAHRIAERQRHERRTGERSVRVQSRTFEHQRVVFALRFAFQTGANVQMRRVDVLSTAQEKLHYLVVVTMRCKHQWRDVRRELRSANQVVHSCLLLFTFALLLTYALCEL